MLRLARQRKRFRQVDAAARLGVEQPVLSRVENGLVSAGDELIQRAELVYEMPHSFFEITDPVYGAPVSVHPMWRRKADVIGRDMDAVVAELNIRVMHLRRLLEGAEYAHTETLPRLDIDDYGSAEKIAGLVRAHWKVPKGPIADLTLLVERAGVIVYQSPLAGAAISGVTFATPGVPPLVVVNSEQPADRRRFTLAHELGHLVMHRFPSPKMEDEANEFASALLMPASDLRPYVAGRRVDLALLASLKPEWKVAMQALLMRVSALNLVTAHQARNMWKQISARRLKLREPPELDFPAEQPTVIDSILRVHLEGLGYSESDLAQLLRIHPWDLRALYGIEAKEPPRPRLTIVR
ncbi:ImmA/IrrE family metallo-endopeptidase [Bauldia litoralis]|nr:ImmA/IrrE family metallo-endopeptidase [Bauldia litoralis]